jgi:hypothetical protein
MGDTDEECGVPSEDDSQWWSEQNTGWHDDEADEEDIDQRAGEAETIAMMEIGLWPY